MARKLQLSRFAIDSIDDLKPRPLYFTIQFDFQGILKRGEFKKGVFKVRHILEDILLVKTRFMKKINTLKHIKKFVITFRNSESWKIKQERGLRWKALE